MRTLLYLLLHKILIIFGKDTPATPPVSRVYIKLGRLSMVLSEYSLANPARPYSGDPLAIFESIWIHTPRRAWGAGFTRPWARLCNLEIEIGGQKFSTEDGELELRPPVALQFRDGRALITLSNTGTAKAYVRLTVFASAGEENYCAMVETDGIPPHGRRQVPVNNGELVSAVVYRIDPDRTAVATVGRLFGRPEWEPYPQDVVYPYTEQPK